MFSKLLAIAQTKVGVAVVAAALVAGGGTAVAVTATNGTLPNLGAHLSGNASHSSDSGTPGDKSGNESHDANHLSVEGALKSYTAPGADCSSSSAASVTPGSISVQPEDQSSDSQDESHSSTPEAEGTHASSSSASQSPVSISITCATMVNGEHASSLADLANAVGQKVQVQATKQDGAWVATKVTVEGSSSGDQHEGQEPTETPGSGDQHEGQEPTETPGSGDHHDGTPGPEPSETPETNSGN